MGWEKTYRSAWTRLSDGAGAAEATQAATVITANDTFVAGGAGIYRVALVGGGGVGSSNSTLGNCNGGGSGFIVYGEVTLTAAENVTVTIGASHAATANDAPGAWGNPTIFGSYLKASGGGMAYWGVDTGFQSAGSGFSGGYSGGNGAGGTDGADGGTTGDAAASGQGPGIIDFLALAFPDVTFAAGAESGAGSFSGGGGGLVVNGSGNYGQGGYGRNGTAGGASAAGICIVAGPYAS